VLPVFVVVEGVNGESSYTQTQRSQSKRRRSRGEAMSDQSNDERVQAMPCLQCPTCTFMHPRPPTLHTTHRMSQRKRLLDDSEDGGPPASSPSPPAAPTTAAADQGQQQQQQQQNQGGQTSSTSTTTTGSGSSSANSSSMTTRRQGQGQGSGGSGEGNDEEGDGQGDERSWAPAEEVRYWAVTQTLRLALLVAFVGLVRSVLSSQAIFYLVLWVASLTSLASLAYQRVRERGLLTYLPPSTQQLLLQTSLLDWLLDTSMADRLKPYAVIGMGLNEEERSFLISSLSPPEQRALTAPGLLNALPASVQNMLLPRGGGGGGSGSGSGSSGTGMLGGGGCLPATPAAAAGGGGGGGGEGGRRRIEEVSEAEVAELTRRRLRQMEEQRRREEGREGREEGEEEEEVMTASETSDEDEDEDEEGREGGRRDGDRFMHQLPRRVGMAMDRHPQRRPPQQENGLRPAFPFSSSSFHHHQQQQDRNLSSTTTITTHPPPPSSPLPNSESWPAPGEVNDVAAYVLQRRLRRAWGQAVRGSTDAIVNGVTESLRRQLVGRRQGLVYGGVALSGVAVVAQVWRGRGGGAGLGGGGGGGGVVQRYGRVAVLAGTVALALYDAYIAGREDEEDEDEDEDEEEEWEEGGEGLWEEEDEDAALLGADSAGVSAGQGEIRRRRRRRQQQQQPRVWVQWGAFFLLLLLIRTGRLVPILRRLRAALPASFSSSSSSSLLLGASGRK